MDISEILTRIDSLLQQKERVIVTIDGNCGAGKTTLAGELSKRYDCNIIHMDDFFLRPEQRTPERFGETGGNIDYERFYEEVYLPLQRGGTFSYRPFDCKTFTLAQPVCVASKQLYVIEGSYSQHPRFGDYSDLRILLTVSPQVQRQRILLRPAHLHKRFFEEWIPMENRYLEEFHICGKADLVIP